jgi:hypothetical protein
MTPDLLFLAEIIDGPKRAKEIHMVRSTRKKWAAILESRGLLLRELSPSDTLYKITKEGRKFAAGNGVIPMSLPYYTDIPTNVPLSEVVEVIPKRSPDVDIIDYIGTLAMLGAFASILTYLTMIWTGYL